MNPYDHHTSTPNFPHLRLTSLQVRLLHKPKSRISLIEDRIHTLQHTATENAEPIVTPRLKATVRGPVAQVREADVIGVDGDGVVANPEFYDREGRARSGGGEDVATIIGRVGGIGDGVVL